MLLLSNCKTFLDYSCEVFVPYLEKVELFPFLSENVVSAVGSERLCITATDENVIANQDVNLSGLMSYTLDEAYERIFLHALHTSEN